VTRALLLIGSLALLAVAVAVGLAMIQAKRLTRPLRELAGAAGRLGSGDAGPLGRRYGIPELDQVAEGATPLPVRAPEVFMAVRHTGSSQERGHIWTHQWTGQQLETYLLDRELLAGGPEQLLPDWALSAYRDLRDGRSALQSSPLSTTSSAGGHGCPAAWPNVLREPRVIEADGTHTGVGGARGSRVWLVGLPADKAAWTGDPGPGSAADWRARRRSRRCSPPARSR